MRLQGGCIIPCPMDQSVFSSTFCFQSSNTWQMVVCWLICIFIWAANKSQQLFLVTVCPRQSLACAEEIFTKLISYFIIPAFLVPSNDGQLVCSSVHLLHMKTTQRNTSTLVKGVPEKMICLILSFVKYLSYRNQMLKILKSYLGAFQDWKSPKFWSSDEIL